MARVNGPISARGPYPFDLRNLNRLIGRGGRIADTHDPIRYAELLRRLLRQSGNRLRYGFMLPVNLLLDGVVEHAIYRSQPSLAWLADLINALAATGMRIGEVIGLRWSDIDFVSGIITLPDHRHSARHLRAGPIRTTKGRRGRNVPIHLSLLSVLKTMARNPDGRVFVGPKKGSLKADVIRSILVREVLTPLTAMFPTPEGEIGFEHGRLHSFRHYFISQAFLGGASEGEIRSWVGHRDSRIIERYRHLRNEDGRRKMEGIQFFKLGPDQTANDSKPEQGAAGTCDESKVDRAVDVPGVPDQRLRKTLSEVPAPKKTAR
jgi:integrase